MKQTDEPNCAIAVLREGNQEQAGGEWPGLCGKRRRANGDGEWRIFAPSLARTHH